MPELYQLVVRRRPWTTVYVRRLPPQNTSLYPSTAVMEARRLFGMAAREARRLSVEEVAGLVGGRVYDRGRQLILMPDGRILPKTAAYISWRLRGQRVSTRPRLGHTLYTEAPRRREWHTPRLLQSLAAGT